MELPEQQADVSHTEVRDYDPMWVEQYDQEARKIQGLLGDKIIRIEHIGSTSVPGLASKPIIDMAIEILSWEDADRLVEPLIGLGYLFNRTEHEKYATAERHLLKKGNPTQFHLSIAYGDKGSFLERQILFRDYLREHDDERDAYGALKKESLKKDSIGKGDYIGSKTDFIMRILKKAGFQNEGFDLSKY